MNRNEPDNTGKIVPSAELLARLRSLPAEHREEEIRRITADDPARAADLLGLLQALDQATGFMENPTVTPRVPPGTPVGQAPLAQEQDDSIGRRIGRYKVLEVIGRGGFGTVYLAEQDEPVRRRVALKLINLGMDTKQFVARFEAERQALAMMDHPSIARVFDAGASESGRPYFVMELVRGESITTYCDRNGMNVRARLNLMEQVCSAVQHAHSKGIIHRDLKPSNILVATHDGVPLAKIIDFGIAKAVDQRLTENTIFTSLGAALGTPAYMSPEQIDGLPDIDTRTDVYSLGVVLYELLVGTPPFEPEMLRRAAWEEVRRIIREVEPPKPSTRLSRSSDSLETLSKQRQTEPPRLSRSVRGELDWIVMKCLSKERPRRYETPSALAADLQRWRTGEAVTAAPPSAAYRTAKFVRRNRGFVAAAAALVIALSAGLIATSWQARVANLSAEEARLASRKAEAALQREAEQRSLAEQSRAEVETSRQELLSTQESNRLEGYIGRLLLAHTSMLNRDYGQADSTLGELKQFTGGRKTWQFWEGRYLSASLQSATFFGSASGASLWCAAYSPDGTRVAAGGYDGTINIYDAHTMQRLRSVRVHDSMVADVVFTADGARVVTLSYDRKVTVIDARSGVVINSIPIPQSFAPPDRILVTVHELESGSVLSMPVSPDEHLADSLNAAIDPNGRLIASGRGNEVAILEVSEPQELVTLTGHTDRIYSWSFSPCSMWIATASADGTARVWDAQSGAERAVLKARDETTPPDFLTANFSADSALVVTTSTDGIVRVWAAGTGQELVSLPGHARTSVSARFSPNGKYIVTTSPRSPVRLWDVSTDSNLPLTDIIAAFGEWTRFTPDSNYLVIGDDDRTARVWHCKTGQHIDEYRSILEPVGDRVFDARGMLVTGGGEYPSFFDLSHLVGRSDRRENADVISYGEWSPDGERSVDVVYGGARVVDIHDWRTQGEIYLEDDEIISARFSSDSSVVFAVSWRGRLITWDVALRRVTSTIETGIADVTAASIADDGGRAVVVSGGDRAVLVDGRSGSMIREFPMPYLSVSEQGPRVRHMIGGRESEFSPQTECAIILPGGQRGIRVTSEKEVWLFDSLSGDDICLIALFGAESPATLVTSASGKRFAFDAGLVSGGTHIFDAEDGRCLHSIGPATVLTEHYSGGGSGWVQSDDRRGSIEGCFSPTDDVFALWAPYSQEQNTLLTLQLKDGKIEKYVTSGRIGGAAFSGYGDDGRLAVLTDARHVSLWDTKLLCPNDSATAERAGSYKMAWPRRHLSVVCSGSP